MTLDKQFDVFPQSISLRRTDPSGKFQRFYRLTVQRDLFGRATLVREWGRVGGARQSMEQRFADEGEAISDLMKRAAAKRRRGYRPADDAD